MSLSTKVSVPLSTKLKDVMQGELISVAYIMRTYWNQFSLGGICKQE